MLNGPRTLPNTFTTASTTAWCSAGTSDLPVIGATRGMMDSFLEIAVGSAARLAAANVATADEAQVITEMRFQAACPVAFPRLLPLGRLLHLGRGEVVERHVFAAAAAATETTGAEDARDGAERRDVLLVVPLVELGLEFGRDVHRVQQQPSGIAGRELVPGQDLIALEAQQTLDAADDALRPRRQVLPADRQIARAPQHRDIVEIVRRNRDLAVLRSDPALAHEEARHALPLRQVAGSRESLPAAVSIVTQRRDFGPSTTG